MEALTDLSARLGRNPLLVQAASGNTSVKVEGGLWIKASGQWLADARDQDIFTCVSVEEARLGKPDACSLSGGQLKPSIETAMHATLPQRVVVHVHSINAIAWAVRQDGREQLATRLEGFDWAWIPHIPSGVPLAQEVRKALCRVPGTSIFVLANHGLVVCGDSCEEAEDLLREVEERLAITPREVPCADFEELQRVTCGTRWRVPTGERLHALGVDTVSRSIFSGGVLYPCQAIFLAPTLSILEHAAQIADLADQPFLIIKDSGVIVSEQITRAEHEMLKGLVEIVQRLDDSAPIRYLTEAEVTDVLTADAYQYRALVEATPESVSLHQNSSC